MITSVHRVVVAASMALMVAPLAPSLPPILALPGGYGGGGESGTFTGDKTITGTLNSDIVQARTSSGILFKSDGGTAQFTLGDEGEPGIWMNPGQSAFNFVFQEAGQGLEVYSNAEVHGGMSIQTTSATITQGGVSLGVQGGVASCSGDFIIGASSAFVFDSIAQPSLTIYAASGNPIIQTDGNEGDLVIRHDTSTMQLEFMDLGAGNGIKIGDDGDAARAIIQSILRGGVTLNFPSTAAGTVSDLTVTVTGAASGDVCQVGAPNVSVAATSTFFCWVSATNTVTIRHSPNGATADPASGDFLVLVTEMN